MRGLAAQAPSVAAQRAASTAAPAAPAAEPQRVSGSRRLPLALMGGALAIALAASGYFAWTTLSARLAAGGADSAAAARTEGQGDKQVTPEQAEMTAAQTALDREIEKEEKEAKERQQARAK
jgi:hypothetical protein